MIDHRDLLFFLAVAEHGTVSAAAAAAYVSQPAVSRRIAGIERQFGVRLFRRTAAGMHPTPAGERLYELALDLRNRMARAEDVMLAMSQGHQSFTVACPETTGNFFIAPFVARGAPIADIRPAQPGLVYELLSTGADIAVNTSPPPPHLVSVLLATTPILVHFPPDTRPYWFDSDQAELTDVARSPMLLPGHGSAIERTVRETALGAGIDWTLARTARNGTMAQAMSAAGHGSAVTIEPADFGLKSVFLAHEGVRLSISLFAAWEQEHYASTELAELAESLGAWMQDRLLQLNAAVGQPDGA